MLNNFKIKTATIMLCVIALGLQMTSCSSSNDEFKLIPVKSGGKWGYIDKIGKYLINPQFQEAGLFEDGLALVQTMDDKYGFINEKGKYVINPQFENAHQFSDGLALVVTTDGQKGFINKRGKYIVGPFDCESTMSYSEGLTFVSPYDSEPVCYDNKGNQVFNMSNVSEIYAFRDGVAKFVDLDGNYGLVNKKGEIVLSPTYDGIAPMSEGLYGVSKDRVCGFIDGNGTIVINPQFDNIKMFHDGLAAFEQNGKWGYVDKKGTIVINPQFDYALDFQGGLASVSTGKQWGVINKLGKYIINPQFDSPVSFKEGLAVYKSGDTYGYVNKKGEIMINPQFDYALNFHNGLAIIVQEGKDDKVGFINKEGEYAITPQFDMTSVFYKDLAFVEVNKKYGIINKEGKYTVNPQFDDLGIDIEKDFGYYYDWYDDEDYYVGSIKSSYAKNIALANALIKGFFDRNDLFAFEAFTVDDFGGFDHNWVESKYEISGKDNDIVFYGYFKNPVYHEETTYSTNWWGERYVSGSERKYHYNEICCVLKMTLDSDFWDLYDFKIDYYSLEKMLVKSLENKFGVKMNYDDYGKSVCFDAANKKGIAIKSTSYELSLYLIQDKSVYDENNKWSL